MSRLTRRFRLHERLLLILSPASMESEWVKTEIAKARKREVKEQRRVLFPVRLVDFEVVRDWECFDGDTGKDSAREIREYFIPDFSHWKDHDSYQTALQRLLNDLKAGAPHKDPLIALGDTACAKRSRRQRLTAANSRSCRSSGTRRRPPRCS